MTLSKYVSVLLVLVGTIDLVNSDASDYFQICHRTDKNLNACILKSLLSLVPRMKDGIPELGIPQGDPMYLDSISFKSGTDNSGLVSNVSKVSMRGLQDLEINDVFTKLSKHFLLISMKIRIPQMRIEGAFELDSKILFLELKGNGMLQINMTDVLCDFTLKAHRATHKGQQYLNWQKMMGTMDFKDARVKLDGLFKDGLLNTATNDIINENYQLLFNDIKPSVLNVLFTTFTEIASNATSKFTLDELLPK